MLKKRWGGFKNLQKKSNNNICLMYSVLYLRNKNFILKSVYLNFNNEFQIVCNFSIKHVVAMIVFNYLIQV